MKWWEWVIGIAFAALVIYGLMKVGEYENQREAECIKRGGVLTRLDGCIAGRRL